MQKRQGITTSSSLSSFPISSPKTEPQISMLNNQHKSSHTRVAIHDLLTTLDPEKEQNVSSSYTRSEPEAASMKGKTARNRSAFHAWKNAENDRGYKVIRQPRKNDCHRSYCRASHGKRKKANEKLRPLNSFIAFRSYYSPIFPEISQKVKSGLLREIWRLDPFKAKWAILAKAYSSLRDCHSDQVSLDSFLSLCGPLIGIVPPESYFLVMGLRLFKHPSNNYRIDRKQGQVDTDKLELTTNLSVNDVVTHCYQSGYVHGSMTSYDANLRDFELAMAATAQTTSLSACSVIDRNPFIMKPSPLSQEKYTDISMPKPNAPQLRSSPPPSSTSYSHKERLFPTSRNTVSRRVKPPPYPEFEVAQNVKNMVSLFERDDESYIAIFNPYFQSSVVTYDPLQLQDDFDSFDFNNFSTNRSQFSGTSHSHAPAYSGKALRSEGLRRSVDSVMSDEEGLR